MADGKDVPIRVEGPETDSAILGFVTVNPGWDGGQPYVTASLLGPRGDDGKRHVKTKNGRISGSNARMRALAETILFALGENTEDEQE